MVGDGRLKASLTPEASEAYFMVVPTPFKGNHEPDISHVEFATRAVLPLLKAGDLYVIESTSPVGTTEKMTNLIYTERPELRDKIYIALNLRSKGFFSLRNKLKMLMLKIIAILNC